MTDIQRLLQLTCTALLTIIVACVQLCATAPADSTDGCRGRLAAQRDVTIWTWLGRARSVGINATTASAATLAGLIHAPFVADMTALGGQTSGVNTTSPGCCFVCLAPPSQHQQGSELVM